MMQSSVGSLVVSRATALHAIDDLAEDDATAGFDLGRRPIAGDDLLELVPLGRGQLVGAERDPVLTVVTLRSGTDDQRLHLRSAVQCQPKAVTDRDMVAVGDAHAAC